MVNSSQINKYIPIFLQNISIIIQPLNASPFLSSISSQFRWFHDEENDEIGPFPERKTIMFSGYFTI